MADLEEIILSILDLHVAEETSLPPDPLVVLD